MWMNCCCQIITENAVLIDQVLHKWKYICINTENEYILLINSVQYVHRQYANEVSDILRSL